jgi:hypothetical protein
MSGQSVAVSELRLAGVHPRWFEALALVRAMAGRSSSAALEPAPGLASVRLEDSGAVTIGTPPPSLAELAEYLAEALPAPGDETVPPVPPGLRYTVVRALGRVAAPPFESLGQFSQALARFEPADPPSVLRNLFERWLRARGQVSEPPAAVQTQPPASPAWDDWTIRDASGPPDLPIPPTTFEKVADAPAARNASSAGPLLTIAVVLSVLVAAATIALALAVTVDERRSHQAADAQPRATTGTSGVGEAPIGAAASDRSGGVPPTDVVASSELVASVDAEGRPVFTPSFTSTGAAIFSDEEPATPQGGAPVGEASRRARVHLLSVQGDGARNYHPRLSPDGSLVAFDSDRDGARGIYLSDRNGRNIRRVSGEGYAAMPAWGPDGRRLAYLRAEPADAMTWNIWVLDLARGEAQRLTSHRGGQPSGASWLPDGRSVCYSHGDRLIVLDSVSGAARSYASPVRGSTLRTPSVSPDGRLAIFQVSRDGAWLTDLTTGATRKVLDDPTAEDFAWSPDGTRVAFHSRRDGQWGLWTASGR